MSERRVLYLAYFFPPRGGAAVQRSLKFAKYLPEFGWRPLVVANGGAIEDKTLKVQDPTLLRELPAGAVVRYTVLTPAEDRRYRRAQAKWRQRLDVTDSMGWWVGPAVRLGLEMAAEHKPEAIVVTMSPFTAARAGIELKRRTGLPLVFDLRDPWALDETRIYPTRWHAGRDFAAMGRAMAAADAVVMNTPQSAKATIEAYPSQTRRADGTSKVVAITNGYDAADFGHSAIPPAPADTLRIVHTGMFHAELAGVWDALHARQGVMNRIKYARRPINLWTRTPRYLLEAIGRVPDVKIELALVGELSPQDRALIEASPVRDRVQMLGYKSHGESVAWLESADVLFLPLHSPLDGGPTLIVPGKAYEYLGSGRPILATCPPGDMRTFVESSRSGVLTAGEDMPAISAALAEFARAKAQGRSVVTQDRAAVERFERRTLTGRLADVLEEVVGRSQV